MKKILSFTLILITFALCATLVYASDGGSGIDVVAKESSLIKTGLVGQKLTFSDTDIKSFLCISDFNSITITKVPKDEDGTLMLGAKKVSQGQVIKRRNVAALSFIPSSDSISESEFYFTVDSFALGAEMTCVMKFIDKVNYSPKIDTDKALATVLTTQRDIKLYGELTATDPEGDALEYMIVYYPKYGSISLYNDGKYVYTPKESYTGTDSFTYVVRDEYGNYSTAAKVSLKVTERMSEVVYADMTDKESYNAAVAMTAMGIMSGDRIGDDMYFNPDSTVTRAEFVAMAMKALGINKDSTLSETFFDDNDQIPKSLLGYVATAQRLGAINGAFDGKGLNFRPNDPITNYEAAVISANLIGKTTSSLDTSSLQSIPLWARGEIAVMVELGVYDVSDALYTNEPITREFAAKSLFKLSSLNLN